MKIELEPVVKMFVKGGALTVRLNDSIQVIRKNKDHVLGRVEKICIENNFISIKKSNDIAEVVCVDHIKDIVVISTDKRSA